jgi:hypothetical protein
MENEESKGMNSGIICGYAAEKKNRPGSVLHYS